MRRTSYFCEMMMMMMMVVMSALH